MTEDAEPVPGMHEHSWDLTAAQERATANPAGGRSFGAVYTNVLGRCRTCGEPGSWTLAGAWTLAQVRGDEP